MAQVKTRHVLNPFNYEMARVGWVSMRYGRWQPGQTDDRNGRENAHQSVGIPTQTMIQTFLG